MVNFCILPHIHAWFAKKCVLPSSEPSLVEPLKRSVACPPKRRGARLALWGSCVLPSQPGQMGRELRSRDWRHPTSFLCGFALSSHGVQIPCEFLFFYFTWCSHSVENPHCILSFSSCDFYPVSLLGKTSQEAKKLILVSPNRIKTLSGGLFFLPRKSNSHVPVRK